MNAAALRLYLVADPQHVAGDILDTVECALKGGVTMVQLRSKSLNDREQLNLAIRLRECCSRYGVPIIINDRLDIALASGSDGIHVGVDDLPPSEVRKLVGPEFIIGYSPETDVQIASSSTEGIDYLGVGPVFVTSTKADAGQALGLKEFSRRCRLSPVPVVGIGGITVGNIGSIAPAGAAGSAIVSAILNAPDPQSAARELWTQSAILVR